MDVTVGDMGGWALLGSGDGLKLERFGDVLVERPSPQAIWPKTADAPWGDARARFHRKEDGSGTWETPGSSPKSRWRAALGELHFEIKLTGFGNVGLFPEHAAHWEWMAGLISAAGSVEVLNLFAYTGGASIVCARAGAKVTHVDAAKSVNAWARDNSHGCSVPEGRIRYLADDALKFARREVRRRHRYHAIILDPPTFGRGPKGEVWKIERDFARLMDVCPALLHDDALFVLATAHSPGVTPAVLCALLDVLDGHVAAGEMLLEGRGPSLPAGAYVRWTQTAPSHR
jgi:23S rRNA (cytosine1962-C5)-methyltransferase